MANERREYPRLSTDFSISFIPEDHNPDTIEYLSAVAENVSLGGMFISTKNTFSKGTVIQLNFHALDKTIEAKAIVRWVRNWRSPRGMGVEFIEFKGLDQKSFMEWSQKLFESKGIPLLEQNITWCFLEHFHFY